MQANEFKMGSTFKLDGKIYTVVYFQHVSQPRLAAIIRTKIKNVETGQTVERSFGPSDYVEDISIEKHEMSFLYEDNGLYYFMDSETYEQIPLNKDTCEDAMKYVTTETPVTIAQADGKIISVTPPLFVNLKIVECEPAVAGDTSRTAYKDAKLETGITVKVPLFVNNEETIKVDTRTGVYVERVY